MKRADLGSRAPNPRPRRAPARRRGDRAADSVKVVESFMERCAVPEIYTPGRCRVCGCTEETACDLGAGFLCWWVDADHTLCSAPKCLAVVPMDELDEAAGIRHTAA